MSSVVIPNKADPNCQITVPEDGFFIRSNYAKVDVASLSGYKPKCLKDIFDVTTKEAGTVDYLFIEKCGIIQKLNYAIIDQTGRKIGEPMKFESGIIDQEYTAKMPVGQWEVYLDFAGIRPNFFDKTGNGHTMPAPMDITGSEINDDKINLFKADESFAGVKKVIVDITESGTVVITAKVKLNDFSTKQKVEWEIAK
jgi:hypothetical protein